MVGVSFNGTVESVGRKLEVESVGRRIEVAESGPSYIWLGVTEVMIIVQRREPKKEKKNW